MEIRDVIGELRERILDLQNQIHHLRLAIHLCEYRLSKLDDVSRETKGDNANGIPTTDVELSVAVPPASAEADLGATRKPRNARPRRAAGTGAASGA